MLYLFVMTLDRERIVNLYFEQLSGAISQEDAVYLEDVLKNDTAARDLWTQLDQKGQQIGMSRFLDQLNPQQELDRLKSRINPGNAMLPAKNKIYKWISVAALFLIIAGSAFWLFYKNGRKITNAQSIATLVEKNKNAIQLRMASGESIDLKTGQPQKELVVNGTVLNIDKARLQFQSGDTATNLLMIPQGQQYSLTLSDGTEVTLNADSRLRFPFHFYGQTREVYLQGEAFFKVAKDSKHPFIVHTPLTKVQVVGTQFNINTYKAGKVATSLLEGKVITGFPGGADRVLLPGHAAVYEGGTNFQIEDIDPDDVTGWMKGIVYFHDMPFHDLLALISRSYGITASLDNAALANRSVSGVLDRGNLPELLEDLKTTLGIKFYYSGKTLHIL